MAYDRFLIAPYDDKSGLQTNVKPWLVPDQAFSELNNAYVFRGRVRKRFGSRWFGDTQQSTRFRVLVNTTNGAGNAAGLVPGIEFNLGQMFSIGDALYTVNDDTPGVQPMLQTVVTPVATYDVTTGAYNFVGAPALTSVYFYPALPVMGLLSREDTATNDEPIVGFDTQFAYEYTAGGWERSAAEAVAGDALWSGDNAQFFWNANWVGTDANQKVFFVTNFNENEPRNMRYLLAGTWNRFAPTINGAADILISARILIPFKNRLLALNTWEGAGPVGGSNYQARCRYSQVGSPLAVDSWNQSVPGKGSAIDAPTTEAIITAEFVKDRLVVFFERSTWEIVYTGNQAYPFSWQQINTELGAESTFSIVPFDKVCIGVGNVGIHACNGANVDRIDSKIPSEIFAIHNADDGVFRVHGIRDYFVETLYWTLPSLTRNTDNPYPDRVLVYNYSTGTWAFNDDSITAFGYFQPSTGVLWSSTTVTWADAITWGSGSMQSRFRQVVAGNQEGFTFIIDTDATVNAAVLQITDILPGFLNPNTIVIASVDNNLPEGGYVYLQDIVGTGNLNLLNNKIFKVVLSTNTNFTIEYEDEAGTIIAGVYQGGGLISRVSQLSIKTKEYNFYFDKARNFYIQKVDFMVDKTESGALTVNSYVSTSVDPLVPLVGDNSLTTAPYPNTAEINATRVVHPMYLWADGEFVQLHLTMTDEQMRNVDIREADFQLHSMSFYCTPTASRPQ